MIMRKMKKMKENCEKDESAEDFAGADGDADNEDNLVLMMMVRKMKMILLVGASRMKEDEVLRIINSGRRRTRPDTFEMRMIFSPVPINNHSLLFYARKLI